MLAHTRQTDAQGLTWGAREASVWGRGGLGQALRRRGLQRLAISLGDGGSQAHIVAER